MILAQEFSRSRNARAADFTTSLTERAIFTLEERRQAPPILDLYANDNDQSRPRNTVRVRGALIAQFAASEPTAFADAVELIRPYVDGVDLNCGSSLASLSLRSILTIHQVVRNRGHIANMSARIFSASPIQFAISCVPLERA